MRDPDRLDPFYEELKRIHKESFPDLRFGQFMIVFISWLQSKKKVDPFFPEEDKMLDYFREFAADKK